MRLFEQSDTDSAAGKAFVDRSIDTLSHWCDQMRDARAHKAVPELRHWDEDVRREIAQFGPLDQRPLGERPIDLQRIGGSVGPAVDMDGRFQPRSNDPHVLNRFRNVCRVMRAGDDLQPITVYKLRRVYYVVDGRHRVGAAKHLGWDTLEANVTVFLPSGDRDELSLFRERRAFEATTELLLVEAARPGTYPALRADIDRHWTQWTGAGKPLLSLTEASLRWYYRRFLPALELIRASSVRGLAPTLCSADILAVLLCAAQHGAAAPAPPATVPSGRVSAGAPRQEPDPAAPVAGHR